MKTGIIVRTDGVNERLIEKQLKNICDGDYEIEEVSGPLIESVDESIERLREQGCDELIVLYESREVDVFEAALVNEYGHLFEKVEVIPEGWYRTLREATPTPAPAAAPSAVGAAQDQTQTAALIGYVFPMSPPTESSLKATNFRAPTAETPTTFINYVTQDMMSNRAFSIDAAQLYFKHFVGGKKMPLCEKAIVVNQGTLLQQLGIKNVYGNNNPTTPLALTNGTLSLDAASAGMVGSSSDNAKLFQALLKIGGDLKNKKVKPDEKRIDEYLKKVENSGKIAYVNSLIASAQAALKHNPRQNGDPNKIVKELMDTFGVTADLQRVAKEMNEGGAGLAVAAGSFIGKQMQKMKKPEEKNKGPHPLELLVSHQDFPIVWKIIPEKTELYNVDSDIKTFIDNKVKNQSKNNEENKAQTETQAQGETDTGRGNESLHESLVDEFIRLREKVEPTTDPMKDLLIKSVRKWSLLGPDPEYKYIAALKDKEVWPLVKDDKTGYYNVYNPRKVTIPYGEMTDLDTVGFPKVPKMKFYGTDDRKIGDLFGKLGEPTKTNVGKIKISDKNDPQKKANIVQETGEILDSITTGNTGGATGFKM